MNARARNAGLIIVGGFALAIVLRLLQQILPLPVNDTSFPGVAFAADGPEYRLPGYHVLAIVIFFVMLVTKRWWFSLPICFGYFLLHLYSIWLRSQGCYLGGDVCPERPILTKLLERLDWIDWVAIPALITLIVIQLFAVFEFGSPKHNQTPQP